MSTNTYLCTLEGYECNGEKEVIHFSPDSAAEKFFEEIFYDWALYELNSNETFRVIMTYTKFGTEVREVYNVSYDYTVEFSASREVGEDDA